MDAIDVIALIFIIIDYFVLCPILVYFLHAFYKISKSINNCKSQIHRSETLVYTINIAILFSVVFERTFLLCSKVWLIFNIPVWMIYMLLSLTWNFIMILFIIKVYHLYYKQNYNIAIATLSWRKDINPNDTDWHISNKQTFGNTLFLIKIALIPYLLSVLIQTIVPYLFSHDQDIAHFVLDLSIKSIFIVMALYIFHKSKTLIDIYGIRHEIFYQCLGITLSLCLDLLITIIVLCINPIDRRRIVWLLHMPITYIVIISIGLLSTIYPIWFIKQQLSSNELYISFQDTPQTMEYIRSSKAMESVISDYQSFILFMQYLVTEFSTENLLFLVELVEIKYSFQTANNNIIRVPRKNLAQPQYYNVFDFVYKRHNTNTTNTTNTTSTQTKQGLNTPEPVPKSLPTLTFIDAKSSNKNDNSRYIVLDFNPNNDTESTSTSKNTLYSFLFQCDNTVHTQLSIPSKLPKSAILANNDNFLDQMKSLYFKYIRSGSLNEINLSYSVRNSVTNFFEHSAIQLNEIKRKAQYYKLFNILDECGLEIMLLMTQSFQRFIKSDKINKQLLQKLINKNLIDATSNSSIASLSLRNADSYSKIKKQRI